MGQRTEQYGGKEILLWLPNGHYRKFMDYMTRSLRKNKSEVIREALIEFLNRRERESNEPSIRR